MPLPDASWYAYRVERAVGNRDLSGPTEIQLRWVAEVERIHARLRFAAGGRRGSAVGDPIVAMGLEDLKAKGCLAAAPGLFMTLHPAGRLGHTRSFTPRQAEPSMIYMPADPPRTAVPSSCSP